ncbi:ornithine cyclodeaminase family protein [Shewanella algae]|uniref:ornithine cyclodeaminase family protein n=1 Tax=Shewanella algae TaxID=38313 RepID=UPI001AAF512A|nr:ornithine cyclodeaminase family protein [Shewanella algae]MBO2680498.1 ornithine cyclodeaminase family protein [Shewanella algae]
MKIIPAEQIQQVLDFPSLITALKHSFANAPDLPKRNLYPLDKSSKDAFAVLPAWDDSAIAVKAFSYFPENPSRNAELKSLYSQILLFSRETGEPLALLDGTSITYWRTAAVSALAAASLAREDASHLLLFGTGNLASYMALAHAAVRPITEIAIRGRSRDKAARVMELIGAKRPDIRLSFCEEIERDVANADIISCATGSPVPLFDGNWVTSGTHVDLVGNHHQDARECDTELVLRSQVFVDNRSNVFAEAGELLLPKAEDVFQLEQVSAELAELCRAEHSGRQNREEITLFKSVGSALGDLSAANLVYRTLYPGDNT